MKRFFLLLAAVAVFASSEAQAGQRYYYRGSNYGYSRSSGPFSRLMEMERAKNAWLRQTFMGY